MNVVDEDSSSPGGPAWSAGVAAGNFFFATSSGNNSYRPAPISEELRSCLDGILAQAHCDRDDIVKLTCWVGNEEDRAEVKRVLSEMFPRTSPVIAIVVAGISDQARVELDAVAYVDRAGADDHRKDAAPFVYTAALAIDSQTTRRTPSAVTIGDETRIVLQRVDERLREAGSDLSKVVKMVCYIREESYRDEFLKAYNEVFAAVVPAARSVVALGLAGDCRVQVEVTALSPTTPTDQ